MQRGERQYDLYALTLILIIVPITSLRFFLLEIAPPGFYVDEAAGATNILCLKEQGTDWTGKQVSLFAEALGGGYSTPLFLWMGSLWTTLFGSSIYALRALSASVSVGTLLGVFLLTRRYGGTLPALWATLAYSISPWSIQFARIFWDPPLHPFFLVFGLYLATRACSHLNAVLSGALLSFAMYSYPPARVQIPLILSLLPWLLPEKIGKIRYLSLLSSLILCSTPLLALTLSGEIQGRFYMVGILTPSYLEHQGLEPHFFNYIRVFLKHLWLHFQPNFFFFTGDRNLRHSTGQFGIMSWLDMLALLCIPGLAFMAGQKGKKLLLLSALSFLLGIVPSALTWEAIPHSLRSIGAMPFLAIFTGMVLSTMTTRLIAIRMLALIVAVTFSWCYWSYYLFEYPRVSTAWFDADVRYKIKTVMASGEPKTQVSSLNGYPPAAIRYYLMHDWSMTCQESEGTAQIFQNR